MAYYQVCNYWSSSSSRCNATFLPIVSSVEHGKVSLRNKLKHYKDGCFTSWNDSVDKLLNFKIMLSSINSNIQFTIEYGNKQLPFFNIPIKIMNNNTKADFFYKLTDSKQYLLFKSCHPKQIKRNTPFNLVKRICTMVSGPNTHELRFLHLEAVLL